MDGRTGGWRRTDGWIDAGYTYIDSIFSSLRNLRDVWPSPVSCRAREATEGRERERRRAAKESRRTLREALSESSLGAPSKLISCWFRLNPPAKRCLQRDPMFDTHPSFSGRQRFQGQRPGAASILCTAMMYDVAWISGGKTKDEDSEPRQDVHRKGCLHVR